eukprot:13582141-Alexandrium_andersonii.AAC.1
MCIRDRRRQRTTIGSASCTVTRGRLREATRGSTHSNAISYSFLCRGGCPPDPLSHTLGGSSPPSLGAHTITLSGKCMRWIAILRCRPVCVSLS